jgi:hypothetical protein
MTPLQLVGFIMLIVGTLVYNEIWVVPIGFMSFNTKREIAKREEEEKGMLDEDGKPLNDGVVGYTKDVDYMNTSPKGYDATRNLRNINNARRSMGGDREKLLEKHDSNQQIGMYI